MARVRSADRVWQITKSGADHLIDVREPLGYAGGHLPGAMCLPVGMIPAFAGWFITEGETIALVASEEDQLAEAMAHLVRIGFDNIIGGAQRSHDQHR